MPSIKKVLIAASLFLFFPQLRAENTAELQQESSGPEVDASILRKVAFRVEPKVTDIAGGARPAIVFNSAAQVLVTLELERVSDEGGWAALREVVFKNLFKIEEPYDSLENYSLLYGNVFPVNKDVKIEFNENWQLLRRQKKGLALPVEGKLPKGLYRALATMESGRQKYYKSVFFVLGAAGSGGKYTDLDAVLSVLNANKRILPEKSAGCSFELSSGKSGDLTATVECISNVLGKKSSRPVEVFEQVFKDVQPDTPVKLEWDYDWPEKKYAEGKKLFRGKGDETELDIAGTMKESGGKTVVFGKYQLRVVLKQRNGDSASIERIPFELQALDENRFKPKGRTRKTF